MTRPAVFLDRDGVLNEVRLVEGRPRPPRSMEELELLPGVEPACRRLRAAGGVLVLVTNQPDIARGTQEAGAVEAMNEHVRSRTGVDHVMMCPHDDADRCACRKPRPGMLLEAAQLFDLDLARSVIVGDRWRDIEAGRNANLATVFIDRGYEETQPASPDFRARELADAVGWIMSTITRPHPTPRGRPIASLSVKVFADGADVAEVTRLAANPLIQGFTTNPTLMRKHGVRDFVGFAREVVELVPDRPISIEVFADDFGEMARQARLIHSWGDNIYVKIPVTTTQGERVDSLLRELAAEGLKLNVTGLLTAGQVAWVAESLAAAPSCFISLFAGRIADAGVDPVPVVRAALEVMKPFPHLELIWASPREVLNLVQADQVGCHIITVTGDLLAKLHLLGRDLEQFSLETVRMFHGDAQAAAYDL